MPSMKKIFITLFALFLVGVLSGNAGKFYPSGNIDIDKIRKEIDSKPTDKETFRERTILMFLWMTTLQQQGADVRHFYAIDKVYRTHENNVNRLSGAELEEAFLRMGELVDRGYRILENIQDKLVKEGPMFTAFESDGKDFPEGGNMETEWNMFQGNKHNTGYTDAPGPRYGKQAWKFPVGLGWYCRPAVEDGRVYVASPGLYATSFCLDLETGNEIWKSTQQHPIFGLYKYPAIASSPVILEDRIILREVNSHGGNEGQAKNLVYIDKETGKTLSRKYAGHVDYRTQLAPVSSNGKYVAYPFGVHDIYGSPAICQNFNRLICADKNNDRKLWDVNIGDIDALAEPVLTKDRVIAGTMEGYLYSLYLKRGWGDNVIAWSFQADGAINTMVVVKDKRIYFGSNGGTVYCLDEENGEQVWAVTMPDIHQGSRKFFSTALLSGDRLYIGSANKRLYCLGISDGEILWEKELSDWIRARPALTSEGIFAATVDGNLHCLDMDGKLKFTQAVSTHPVYADLVSEDGKLLITDSNLWLYCLNGTGEEVWKHSILSAFINKEGERIFTDQLSGGTYYQSKPTSHRGKIFFGNPAGFLYGLDAESGEEIWKFEMGAAISVGPACEDGKIYAGQQGGERFFYCLDAEDGSLIWKQTLPGGWVWGSATVDEGLVYVPTVNGYAVCLDGATGHIIWMYPAAKSVPAEPAIDGDLVYFGSWSRSLYAFDKKTGEIVWKTMGVGLDSGTLIAKDGKIYVPHHDNIFKYVDAKTGEVLCEGNLNEEEKGNYSNFNASPAFHNDKAIFTARVGIEMRGVPVYSTVYCVDAETGNIHWTFPDGGGLSAPAIANDRVYIGSANSPFFFCLDENTAEVHWIYKLGNRIEESTLCIYRDKVYLLSADGYVHAIE